MTIQSKYFSSASVLRSCSSTGPRGGARRRAASPSPIVRQQEEATQASSGFIEPLTQKRRLSRSESAPALLNSVEFQQPMLAQAISKELATWVSEAAGPQKASRARVAEKIMICWNKGDTSLDLGRHGLTSLPVSIGRLKRLMTLRLKDNALKSLPESIGQLRDLKKLELQENALEALPESIGRLHNLTALSIRNNKLKYLPNSIGQLVKLKELDLENNCLKALPESIGRLGNLMTLFVGGNALEVLPESIGHLHKLEELNLHYNHLTTMSESLGQLHNLVELDLHHNHLTALPQSIERLSRLRKLYLGENALSALPDSLGYVHNLVEVYLHCNHLTTVPHSLGQLENLRRLDLVNNHLRSLPDSIASLHRHCVVRLDANHISLETMDRLRVLPSTPRIELVSEAHDIDLVDSFVARPLDQAVRAWEIHESDVSAKVDGTSASDDWESIGSEPMASDFSTFLDRLSETADARSALERLAFRQRIADILNAIKKDPGLRAVCFVAAENALGACGDRIALGIQDIELSIIDCRAERNLLDESEILLLGKQYFRLNELQAIARKRVEDLHLNDEIEVYLAYQVELKDLLPCRTERMLFPNLATFGQDEIDLVRSKILKMDNGPAMRDFLVDEFRPWQNYLARIHQDAFDKLQRSFATEEKRLAEMTQDMTDGEYLVQTKALMDQKTNALHQLRSELTEHILRTRYEAQSTC